MGYFDALTSASFKTAADGSRLFFPYGIWGRGYAIPSEQDYGRLQRQLKTYYAVMFTLIIGGSLLVRIIDLSLLQTYVAEGVVVAVLLGFHQVWMRSVRRRLQPSNEALSLQESLTTQARLAGPAVLWSLEIISLIFVGGGIAMLISDPSNWLAALAATVFFGACSALTARMILLRRRAASSPGGN